MTLDGPPAQSEGDTTRDRLLEVAERLFAEKGFDGAPVREITTAAGCNIASVNYHFGSKENLYAQVFQRRLSALREMRVSRLERALEEGGEKASVELVLETFTTAFLEPLADESEGRLIMELMSREMLNPHLPAEVFFEQMIDPVSDSLARTLRRVAPGLDDRSAKLCVHSVVGQLVHVIHYARLRFGADAAKWPGTDLELMARHITRFSTAGVQALAAGGSS